MPSATSALEVVDGEVRELIRRRGLDPFTDPGPVRLLVRDVVADYSERALTLALPAIADPEPVVRDVLDRVAGFGPPQRWLDDPEVEETSTEELLRVPLPDVVAMPTRQLDLEGARGRHRCTGRSRRLCPCTPQARCRRGTPGGTLDGPGRLRHELRERGMFRGSLVAVPPTAPAWQARLVDRGLRSDGPAYRSTNVGPWPGPGPWPRTRAHTRH